MRSCMPARRWSGTRIAAGGTLKVTPATVIGSEGASSDTGGLRPARPQHVADEGDGADRNRQHGRTTASCRVQCAACAAGDAVGPCAMLGHAWFLLARIIASSHAGRDRRAGVYDYLKDVLARGAACCASDGSVDVCEAAHVAGLRSVLLCAGASALPVAGLLATRLSGCLTRRRRASGCAAGAASLDLRGSPVPGLRRALHHHAQHDPRLPHRRPPLRDRMVATIVAGLLEPDVRHRRGDGAARAAASNS